MLAAMMTGNRPPHNLFVNGNFTVPSGVTTVYITAAAKGGEPGTNSEGAGPYGGGGGGAGAFIIRAPLSVSSGQVLSVDTGTDSRYFIIKRDSTDVATLWYGASVNNGAAGGAGGTGGRAEWNLGTLQWANGGTGGSVTTTLAGQNGETTAISTGGTLYGGGGGGSGNLTFPVTAGGAGGSGGSYTGGAGIAPYGGAGGGLIPGGARLSSTVTSVVSNSFAYITY